MRQGKGKQGPFPRFRFHCYPAAHQQDKGFGDGESETGAFFRFERRCGRLTEPFKNEFLLLLRDSRPGIADPKNQLAVLLTVTEFNFPLCGKLQGIAYKICQDLLQFQSIGSYNTFRVLKSSGKGECQISGR